MPLTAPFSFDSHAETDGRVLSSFHRQLVFFRKSAKTEIFEKRGAPPLPKTKRNTIFFECAVWKERGRKTGQTGWKEKAESRRRKWNQQVVCISEKVTEIKICIYARGGGRRWAVNGERWRWKLRWKRARNWPKPNQNQRQKQQQQPRLKTKSKDSSARSNKPDSDSLVRNPTHQQRKKKRRNPRSQSPAAVADPQIVPSNPIVQPHRNAVARTPHIILLLHGRIYRLLSNRSAVQFR